MKTTAAQIKRNIGGVEWTAVKLGECVILSADLTAAEVEDRADLFAMMMGRGWPVDICADPEIAEPGKVMVSVRTFETEAQRAEFEREMAGV